MEGEERWMEKECGGKKSGGRKVGEKEKREEGERRKWGEYSRRKGRR